MGQGRPGAGKTILSNQIAFSRAAEGARVLYVTLLSESHERLFQALATLDFFDRSKLGDEIVYIRVFQRSEAHTSELQSLMRTSYAVFCLKKKKHKQVHTKTRT